MAARFVLVTGCSGGGKSTLLAELADRGYATVPEPGRRIVQDEVARGGTAVPWVDPMAFVKRAVEMSRADLSAAKSKTGFVFFDRGLLDAAVALDFSGGADYRTTLGDDRTYERTVFLAPPWPEVFTRDAQRQHDLDAAIAEYDRIKTALEALDYDICLLPKTSVTDRADLVLSRIGVDRRSRP